MTPKCVLIPLQETDFVNCTTPVSSDASQLPRTRGSPAAEDIHNDPGVRERWNNSSTILFLIPDLFLEIGLKSVLHSVLDFNLLCPLKPNSLGLAGCPATEDIHNDPSVRDRWNNTSIVLCFPPGLFVI
ncbi:hypothetical protein CEXT_479511 [Caerostris extrusa]|uniref:Uncharacterized protein n=1 Tax=Caerostris extrusa TaxID=172846 RepID=A0AAV4MKM5_CAEEX|nr:hypothetical protein CEXT_479511 [Caerostris extrusa]